ncbi:MAG: hypothetical protein ACYC6T_09125 [Thermoleophilia bacterium]
MEHQSSSHSPTQTLAPAVPRALGFVMLGVTLASIVLLLFGLIVHVS